MTRGGIGWRAWWRRTATDRVLMAALAVSMLVAAGALAAVPRVVERASVDDLRHTIDSAQPERRNVRLGIETRIAATPNDPLGAVRDRGDALVDDELPPVVADVVEERRVVIDSPPFRVTSYPEGRGGPFTTSFRFRIQEGVDAESTLVDGFVPAPHAPIAELTGTQCDGLTVDTFVADDDVDCERIDVPVFETAITRQTADDMDVDVGDLVTLTPDQADLRWARAGAGDTRLVLRVAGIVELSDAERPYWYADNRLHGPRITESPDFRIVDATGLLTPDQYAALQRSVPRVGFDHAWRLYVGAERFDVDLADDVAIALANADLGAVTITTDLPELVKEFRAQRTVVLVLLSTVAVGLGVVVAATIGALVRLLALRRATSTALVVARGATRWHLLADAGRTCAVVVVPAAVGGGVVAALSFPGTAGDVARRVLVGFGTVVAVTIVAVLGRPAARPMARAQRVVFDVTVVVAALAAVLSVRRRGDVSVDGVADVDALLAATPALVVVAAALLLVRVVPMVGRAAAALTERRPGLASFLGFRQLVARPGAARTATGVTAVAVGIAVAAAAMQASISTARSAASWYEVGGEVVVTAQLPGAPLPLAVDEVVDQAGPDDVARRVTVDRATVRYGTDSTSVDVVAVDAATYADLLADAPIDRVPLESLAAAAVPGAIVSTAWPRSRVPDPGDELTVDLGAGPTTLVVTVAAATFPGVRVGRPFVVVDIESAGVDVRPSALVVGDRTLADRLVQVPRTRVVDRQEVVAELAADPLGRWTVRILAAVAVLSGMFAMVAAVTSVAISVRARERDLSVLRTLGLRVREGATMTAVEQFPALAVATVGGVVAGSGAVWLVQSALGLARFAGSGRPVAIRLEPGATLFTAGLVAIAMTLAVVISISVQRRHDLAATLRVGDTT